MTPPLKLYKALFAAQKEMPPIPKKGKGQHGPCSKLEDIIEATKPILEKHGLMFVQTYALPAIRGPEDTVDFENCLQTDLIHVESGEYIRSMYWLVAKPDFLSYGAATTYHRKYAQLCLLNLASEDDPDMAAHAARPAPQARTGAYSRPQGAKPALPATGSSLAGKQIKCGKKFNGLTYGQVPLDELANYGEWIKREVKQQNAYHHEFLADLNQLQMEASMAGEPEGPPNDFAPPDETIPF
jgi:hypothetical protein